MEQQVMLDQVRQCHAALAPTTLIVEHDVDVIMGVAERMLVMNCGKQFALGSPRELQNDHHPQVIEAYLGGSRHQQSSS